MPFQSEKQRRFLWLNHPEVARRWTKEYGSDTIKKAAKKRLKNEKKNQGPRGRRS